MTHQQRMGWQSSISAWPDGNVLMLALHTANGQSPALAVIPVGTATSINSAGAWVGPTVSQDTSEKR